MEPPQDAVEAGQKLDTETFIKKSRRKWAHKLKYVIVGSFATSLEASIGGLVGTSIGWLTIQHALSLAFLTAMLTAARRACGFLSVNPVPPIEPDEKPETP